MPEDHQCQGRVYNRARGSFHPTRKCSYKGVNYENDKWWCKTHTPSLVKAKRDAEFQAYQHKCDLEGKSRRLRALAVTLLMNVATTDSLLDYELKNEIVQWKEDLQNTEGELASLKGKKK